MPNWISGSSVGRRACRRRPWRGWSSARRSAWGRRRGAGACMPLVSPMARPSTSAGLLLAVGVAQVAGQVDGVVQRDHRGAFGGIGQKRRGKVEIGDSRVVVGLVECGVAARPSWRSVESCLPSRDQASCDGGIVLRVATTGRNSSMSPEPGGPVHQGAHRRAVALDLGLDVDHVARIEAEGLHHIEAVGGVVKGERAGRLKDARRRSCARRRRPGRAPGSTAWSAPAHR